MKFQTKLLIIASACLVALSFAACGNQSGGENTTDTVGETVSTALPEDKPDVTVDESDSGESNKTQADETEAPDPSESQATPSVPTETTDETHKTEETEEVAGPVPPPPVTEAPTEAPTEPIAPDFGDLETNEDGVIELPFVPFD